MGALQGIWIVHFRRHEKTQRSAHPEYPNVDALNANGLAPVVLHDGKVGYDRIKYPWRIRAQKGDNVLAFDEVLEKWVPGVIIANLNGDLTVGYGPRRRNTW